MKRKMTALIAAVGILLTLSACGSGKREEKPPATPTPTAAQRADKYTTPVPSTPKPTEPPRDYIVNTESGIIHDPGCRWVAKMNDENKLPYTGQLADLTAQGYETCGVCHPK